MGDCLSKHHACYTITSVPHDILETQTCDCFPLERVEFAGSANEPSCQGQPGPSVCWRRLVATLPAVTLLASISISSLKHMRSVRLVTMLMASVLLEARPEATGCHQAELPRCPELLRWQC